MAEMRRDKVISEDFSLLGQLPHKSLPVQNHVWKIDHFCLWIHSGVCKAGKSRLCKPHLTYPSAHVFSSLALVCSGPFSLLSRVSPDVGCSQIVASPSYPGEVVLGCPSCCSYRKESGGCTSIAWKGSASSSLQLSQVARVLKKTGGKGNPKPLMGEALRSSVISKSSLRSSTP